MEFELIDTLVGGFAVSSTLGHRSLAVSSSDADSVNDVALLGLVPESASLIRARRAGASVDDIQLSVLPASCL